MMRWPLTALLGLLLLGCPPATPTDDDTGDDDTSGDDDTTGDDDTGDDDTGDDDTGDDDTAPVDADGDGWSVDEDCDDNDPALNLDDADSDGYDTCNGDCNDGNGAINPLATDMAGDGIDQNCDGADGFDGDGDGYAAEFTFGDDCDDGDPAIHPGAPDPCDGIDQDCGGDLADEADDDGDGYRICDGDCDDGDPAVSPGETEVICDGIDQDCDPFTPDVPGGDGDGDGFDICEDCDDGDPDVNPDAAELCDGIDNDCDLAVDETCTTDSFVQQANGWADVLFVVDNSCSMTEEQVQLGADFSLMLDEMDALAMDYRIAVVTTDDGEFQAGEVIDPTTVNAAATFASLVNVGTNGSWEEKGFEFGVEALTLAAAQTSPNDGFFRDEAGLRVVFVGDEDDQSTGTVGDWLQQFASYKLNPDHVVLHGFSGEGTGCSGVGGNADPAVRFTQAITATGGLSFPICDLDWSPHLVDLGAGVDFWADTFPLTSTPIQASLEVEVNGVLVQAGWTFEPAINAVVFDLADVPLNGDLVDISYAY